TCRPYLVEQIDIIQPTVLIALGAVAVEGLLGTRAAMRELRGRWHTYNSIPLMITYHPAYLLRNQAPSEKRKVWEDMLQVLERLGRPKSERKQNYFLWRRSVSAKTIEPAVPRLRGAAAGGADRRYSLSRSKIASIRLRDASVRPNDKIMVRTSLRGTF